MDLGFRPEHVLRAGIVPNMGGYTHAEGLVLFDKLEDRIQALPGVQRVAWATTTPLQAVNIKMGDVYVDGLAASPTEPNRDHISLMIDWISDSYFDVMGTRLISGRAFTAQDDSTAPRVAIVNATAAKTLWPGKEPIGQRFRTSRSGPLVEVVGVAQDGRYLFVNEPLRPFVYYPIKQDNGDERILLVQTTGDPAALAGGVRATLAALAPDLAPIGLLSMNAYLRSSVSFLMLRLAAMQAGAIGLLTLVQASIGLYGVLTYTVAQRAREIGIRIALGADRGRVLRLIVGQGGYLIAAGLGIGLVLAYVASRGLQAFLVGVSAGDLLTFGVALGVLGVVALLATYLPARRAARMDPVKALRADS
jgi:putative ABC transport system permease protein